MPNSVRLIGVFAVALLITVAAYRLWPWEREVAPPVKQETLAEAARDLHERRLTIDTHVDIPLDWATDAADPGIDGRGQVDLPKMRAGGLDAAFFIVYVGQDKRDAAGYANAVAEAMTKFAAIHRMTDRLYPDKIGLALSAADVERLNAEGKLVALIGIENGYVLGGRLEMLEIYRDLGARYIGLVHNGHNDLADSAQPMESLGDGETEHGGLSDFGKAVVREANRLGIMVDVSHASKRSTLDAVKVSRAPVIASHSSARALTDHPRNLDDKTLKAIARKGGVIQVVAFDAYLHDVPKEKGEALKDAFMRFGLDNRAGLYGLDHEAWTGYQAKMEEIEANWPRADIAALADHIDHVVEVAGIDHVGISSDFGGGGGVTGWMDAGTTAAVTDELVKRGYSEDAIAKIWGGNLLRVMREVEKAAKD